MTLHTHREREMGGGVGKVTYNTSSSSEYITTIMSGSIRCILASKYASRARSEGATSTLNFWRGGDKYYYRGSWGTPSLFS